MWVEEVIEDATQIILDHSDWNSPPSDDKQYVMVRIKVRNEQDDPDRFSTSDLNVVGNSGVEYGAGCGGGIFDTTTIPDRLSNSRVFKGGELSGNICFSVNPSDANSLVMYDDPWSSNWTFFALR